MKVSKRQSNSSIIHAFKKSSPATSRVANGPLSQKTFLISSFVLVLVDTDKRR